MENEIWKPVVGYEGLYEVSNLWNIRSLIKNINRKMSSDKNWYKSISLYKESLWRTFKAHRIVAITFIPNPENKPQVNHKDGNKNNNSVNNLEWNTGSENQQHRFKVLKHIWPNTWYIWLKNKRSKKIQKYSLKWDLIEEFNCVMDIQRKFWFKQWPISCCARWEKPSMYWFKWRYK